MQAMNLDDTSYYCNGCNRLYVGKPMTREVLDSDYPEGYDIEEVGTYTQYRCHDGNPPGSNPCNMSEDDMEIYSEAWQCGVCDHIWGTLPEAIDCCSS